MLCIRQHPGEEKKQNKKQAPSTVTLHQVGRCSDEVVKLGGGEEANVVYRCFFCFVFFFNVAGVVSCLQASGGTIQVTIS